MIAKFASVLSSVLGLGLITATASPALAHDQGPHGNRPPPASYPGAYRGAGPGRAELDELRRSDLNRDGWVTLAEAQQHARRDFRRNDRDQNRLLTPREVSWNEISRDDRDRNGAISYGEYQDAIRRSFYQLDTNRDGLLAGRELGQPMGPRAAGWRR